MHMLIAIQDSASTTVLAAPVVAPAPAATAAPLSIAVLVLLMVVGSGFVIGWSRWVRPMNLAIGFVVTVAMWTLSYVALLQPGFVAGEALFVGALACVLFGGFMAGRFAPGQASGLSVGLVSATINMMVLGAFLRDEQGGSPVRPAAYVIGLFAASALLGSIGERIGSARSSARRLPPPVTLMGIVATANILVMIVIGGLVTGYEAGLAVPDWPNSFGHNMLLYPVSEMKGGIFYEHAHRLFGMLVGATVLAYATTVWRSGASKYARIAVTVLLALVVTQGILGGLRVTGTVTSSMNTADLSPSIVLAIVHGMLGQFVFTLALISAFMVSGAWARVRVVVQGVSAMRLLSAFALLAVTTQLFLGAAMRHLQIPPTGIDGAQLPKWALHGHVTVAVIAFTLVLLAGMRCGRAVEAPPLRRVGKAALHTVGLQVALGIAALVVVLMRRGEAVPIWEVATTTAHQALGAVLLAEVATMAVLARRTITATA
ncbi:MAG: COX15/CtaA family protein [Planctomycetota bacterium]|nr:COX15/CtaA family protein [Planctomycetota bacterium]